MVHPVFLSWNTDGAPSTSKKQRDIDTTLFGAIHHHSILHKFHVVLCMSNVQNPCDIPLYWLGNRDPYSGWKNNPHITGMYNPLYTANNQGFGHCSGVEHHKA